MGMATESGNIFFLSARMVLDTETTSLVAFPVAFDKYSKMESSLPFLIPILAL